MPHSFNKSYEKCSHLITMVLRPQTMIVNDQHDYGCVLDSDNNAKNVTSVVP